jgi:hypothetical protein
VHRDFSVNPPERGYLAMLETKRIDDFELYWQGEKDWL